MNVDRHGAYRSRSRKEPQSADETGEHQNQAGVEEEPSRTIEKKKPQAAPAVPPRTEMRWTGAAIRRQCCRHLDDFHFVEDGLDHHLRRELHSRSPEIHLQRGVTRKATEPAVEVAAWRPPKQHSRHRGEAGIAQIAV